MGNVNIAYGFYYKTSMGDICAFASLREVLPINLFKSAMFTQSSQIY